MRPAMIRSIAAMGLRRAFTSTTTTTSSFRAPTPITPVARRFYAVDAVSPMGGPGDITVEECTKFAQKLYAMIDDYMFKAQLQAVKMMPKTLTEKWNLVAVLLLREKLRVLKTESGIEGQPALLKVQALSMKFSQGRENPEFQKAMEWENKTMNVIFTAAFGKPVPPNLDVVKTRKIAYAICGGIFEDGFLSDLRAQATGITDPMKKNEIIVSKLHAVQTSVLTVQGYTGDDGFLTVQKALMDHAGDQFVQCQTFAYNFLLIDASGLKASDIPQQIM